MSRKPNLWVSPREGGQWGVHKENSIRDTKLFSTQKEAMGFAGGIAKNQGVEVITQGKNGQIQSKDSYGNDPNPPNDKEH